MKARQERRTEGNLDSTIMRQTRWLPTPGNMLFTLLVAGLCLWIVTTSGVGAGLRGLTDTNASESVIDYAGYLTDADGEPLNGSYALSFTLYDAPTSGNIVWGPELHETVAVIEGRFSAGIGSATANGLPNNISNTFLEIAISGEPLSPREELHRSGLTEFRGTYVGDILVSESGDGSNTVSISPTTIELAYRRIGSMVFVSVPFMTLNQTGRPRVMEFTLPFPAADANAGGAGSLTCCGHNLEGNLAGVLVHGRMSFRHRNGGFPGGFHRAGFWYIAAD